MAARRRFLPWTSLRTNAVLMVLAMLVLQPGQLLTKDELLTRIWPDAFVEEGILTVHVSAVRKALGDDARPPTYIETLSRSGYRFIAPVSTVPFDAKSGAAREMSRPLGSL